MTDIESRLTAALEGRYTLERPLGEGGMATVYLARDVKHDRYVAIKVLKPELAAMLGGERFLATYGGWAVSDQAVQPELVALAGSYLPFPPDAASRAANGDPRRSVAERYGSREEYLGRYMEATMELVADGLILVEDVPVLVQIARDRWALYERLLDQSD